MALPYDRLFTLRAIFTKLVKFDKHLSSASKMSTKKVVEHNELRRFIVDSMVSVKVDLDHSNQLADVLIAGDARGHYSHGINRLEMYVNDIKTGMCEPCGQPEIIKENLATGWVDGKNLLGPVVSNFSMDLAIRKAKEAGIGFVVAKGSNHFGIAGYYSMKAMEKGLIGLAFTNTSPISYPTRASVSAIGTNPISLAAKGAQNSDNFVLDMATTTVAVGKVEMADRKSETIPPTWGVDGEGKVTDDPRKVFFGGGLFPLGGPEVMGGYKGYGLQMMVEIFCGILGGAAWGPNIRKWMATDKEADLGQCFIAIDPESFAPGFSDRLQNLIDTMRGLPTAEKDKPVLVAGDPEREHLELCRKLGGIPYHQNQILKCNELAKELEINELRILSEVE